MDEDDYFESIYKDKLVCEHCFADPDIKELIRTRGTDGDCTYCNKSKVSTISIWVVCQRIKQCLEKYYGKAAEQLPHESADGGYIKEPKSTEEILFWETGLDLPFDPDEHLKWEILNIIGSDEAWCDYDWLSYDLDKHLSLKWDEFCLLIKHHRRFFFSDLGGDSSGHPDGCSIGGFLTELAKIIEKLCLVIEIEAGYITFRARPRSLDQSYLLPNELGPPPAEKATTSNRMSPPGIPVFYAAESEELAIAEIRDSLFSLGKFVTTKQIKILDLANLPEIPGVFSDCSRDERLALTFLHRFADEITKPIARDERVHLEYVPTQVISEFFRDFEFDGGKIDGIRYSSALGVKGANVVLFATQEDVVDAVSKEDLPFGHTPWLELEESQDWPSE